MEIKYHNSTWPPADGSFKNALVLYADDWNDYGYRTTFHMVYMNDTGHLKPIGPIKIYFWDYDCRRDEKSYTKAVCDLLDQNIKQLDERYCSLGQNLNFYQNLKKIVLRIILMFLFD